MPIYEYRCTACEHELEVIQKISADPLTDCPACGAPALKKKISVAGFRLKGGGWYETDFKTQGQKNVAKDDGPAKESKAADSATKPSETTKSSESTAKPDSTKATAAV